MFSCSLRIPVIRRAFSGYGLVAFAIIESFISSTAGVSAPLTASQPVAPAASTALALVDGYVLKQDGKTVGPQVITVTPRGLRCESLRSHVVLLCAAPDWQVLIYNLQTKRSYATPIKQFRGYLQRQMVLFSGTSFFDKPVILKSKKVYFGLPGSLYTQPPGYREKLTARYHQHLVPGGEPAQIAYKTLELPGVTREEESVLERYYGVPEKGGLPVDYTYVMVGDDRRSFLTTAEVAKRRVEEALFKPPAGLKAQKNLEQVFLDSASEGSDDLLDMFSRK